jgi:fatty-acyl-CoA synthase
MTRSFDWIAHHALTRPDKVATVDLASGRTFTYAEMDDRTSRLASALAETFDVGPGDRIAVLANNNSNFFEVEFACWKLAAIFVPLNWRLALAELEFIVGDCTPTVMIIDDDFLESGIALSNSTGIAHLINWDGGSDLAADYEDAIASASPMIGAVDTTHDTPLTIMYTSGTTGRPKGAIITHGMVFFNAVNCTEFFRLGTDMVNLAFLPLFHIAGLNTFANPAYHFGGTNIVMRDFEPAACLDLISDPERGITHFLGVPTNYLFMSQVPAFSTATFPTVKAAALGGAPSPLPLLEAWGARGLPLQQGYGMTETAPLVTALKPEDCMTKIGSAGLPALHNQVRIVDEKGNDSAVGEVGELWTRGPNVTPGYWEFPEANASSFEDGYLKTGDAAYKDDEGFIFIVDRWKDMYISGGENVYPAEVETVIYQLPEIAEVAIIGKPDDKWGEVGMAIVVLKPETTLDEQAIINHCAKNLAKFKVPRSVVYVPEIPHNATGKMLKRELRVTHID